MSAHVLGRESVARRSLIDAIATERIQGWIAEQRERWNAARRDVSN